MTCAEQPLAAVRVLERELAIEGRPFARGVERSAIGSGGSPVVLDRRDRRHHELDRLEQPAVRMGLAM